MQPKVCLLITTYKRPLQLQRSLERLLRLTPPDEIIIVNDGGADETAGIASLFSDRLPIRYIFNNNPDWSICSMARNIGIKNTDADIVITSEPECLWITDIVPHVLKEREEYPNQIISAGVVYFAQERTSWHPGLVTDPTSALKDYKIEEYQIQPRSYSQLGFVRTFNMQATFVAMYERQWLLDIGGWDEAFPGAWGFDDIELATRLRISRINQHICPDMEIIHQWHPHLPPHLQGPAMFANEAYMKSKKLDEITDPNDPGLIANKGKEWGVIL